MARCGHARPRAPRRAGGRLPRRPRRARPARRRSGHGPAARRLGAWSATPRPPRPPSAGCSRPSDAGAGRRTCPPTTRVPSARCGPGSRPPSGPTPSCRSRPRSSEPRATTPRRGPRPSRPAARSSGSASRAATGRSRTTSRSTASAWPARRSWPGWRPSPTRRGGDACSWRLEPLWRAIDGDGVAIAGPARDRLAVPGAAPGIARSLGRRRLPHRRQRAGARARPRATSSGGRSPPSRRGGTR